MKGTRFVLTAAVAAALAACDGSVAGPAAEAPDAPRLITFCNDSQDTCGPTPREPIDTTTQTGGPPIASFRFDSRILALLTRPAFSNTLVKHVEVLAESEALGYVSYTSVHGDFSYFAGCHATQTPLPSRSKSANGSPVKLVVGFAEEYPQDAFIKWRVIGTHTFTPVAGATGGGTFQSSDEYCY